MLDAMCWFFWDATIFCDELMFPKRRFLEGATKYEINPLLYRNIND